MGFVIVLPFFGQQFGQSFEAGAKRDVIGITRHLTTVIEQALVDQRCNQNKIAFANDLSEIANELFFLGFCFEFEQS
jgi:hypothetical protein